MEDEADGLKTLLEVVHLLQTLRQGGTNDLFYVIREAERYYDEQFQGPGRSAEPLREFAVGSFFRCIQEHVLRYPDWVYERRIRQVAERLKHPVLLAILIPPITRYLSKLEDDPLDVFDDLVEAMTAKS